MIKHLIAFMIGFTLSGLFFCFICKKPNNPTPSVIHDTIKVDNSNHLDSIKNSELVIKIIEKEREKDLIDITNQSISADAEFFSKFLSENFE